jgi:hypothetical protein
MFHKKSHLTKKKKKHLKVVVLFSPGENFNLSGSVEDDVITAAGFAIDQIQNL